MKKKWMILLSIPLLLIGCGTETSILEDIYMAEVVGFDAEGQDKVKGSVIVSFAKPGEEATMSKEMIQSVTHSLKNVKQENKGKSPLPIAAGRLEVILYGEELAKKGLRDYVDTYRRDPNIGTDLFLAVVDSRAEDVIKVEKESTDMPRIHTKELIEQNNVTNLPASSLQRFLYSWGGKGLDPVLPLLDITKKGEIRIKGIALFRDDRYIGKHVSYMDGFLFKMIMESFRKGTYELKWKNNDYININNIKSKVRYRIENANENPRVRIEVNMKGGLLEAQGYDINKEVSLGKIEKKAQKEFEERIKKMVRFFQENHIDPLAIGDRARSKTRGFNFKHWEEVYPDIPIDVKVNIQFIQEGISE
ncbi:Ger(x)C family spore germination protein [Bacillus massiliglaciei]|uniref:Ger(x)C family spore germination protein n=1 Tax=Bacillus massiliglaciei TaxID=1816693 RepID=UPI000DA5FC43|nr:Ger(x)C family spore germination protein [Bacillus massiliglaciei]